MGSGFRPTGSDPGIWVTQPLALAREKNNYWRREITRSVGVSAFERIITIFSDHRRFQLSATFDLGSALKGQRLI